MFCYEVIMIFFLPLSPLITCSFYICYLHLIKVKPRIKENQLLQQKESLMEFCAHCCGFYLVLNTLGNYMEAVSSTNTSSRNLLSSLAAV